jgi:IclR family acetate operon transcriptional repressor
MLEAGFMAGRVPTIAARRFTSARAVSESKAAPQDPKYYSRAIGKALDVLTLLKSSPLPLSFNDLLRDVKLVKSSLFRIIYTLEEAGYVLRTDDGLYEIPFDIRYQGGPSFNARLVEIATPWMAQLSRELRATISIGALMTNHVEVVAVIESLEWIRMSSVVGRILPPHASSLGNTITAYQPEQLRGQLVRNYGLTCFTPKTITDEVQLREEYSRIRAAGYGRDREETTMGGCCFGTPVFTDGDTVLSGISASLPKTQLAEQQPTRIIAELQSAARVIGKALEQRGT